MSEAFSEARTGRENQLYNDQGVRQVAVAIPVDSKEKKVLVISSSKHVNVWVLPKGGWENDETQQECAKRETYEEAGVLGEVTRFIGNYQDYTFKGKPKTYFWVYEIEVREVLQKWPECEYRQRRWCTFDEAIQALSFKPFMQDALRKSSIAPLL